MALTERENKSFKTRGRDGREYTVIEYHVIEAVPSDAIVMATYRTASGLEVHRIDNDNFQIVKSMVLLRRKSRYPV